jgi:hypothetical protein
MAKKAEEFTIKIVRKSERHPEYKRGSEFGFAIQGVEGALLEVKRGQSYYFRYESPAPIAVKHPLYFTKSPIGGARGAGSLPGFPILKNVPEALVHIPDNAPKNFYYQCTLHNYMGGPIKVID